METKTAQLELRRATKTDVLNPKGTDLRLGVVYYVESVFKPDTFCGPMTTADHTDKIEFSSWYKEGRVWVPLMAIDNRVILVTENNQG